jgi:hypothetical protein
MTNRYRIRTGRNTLLALLCISASVLQAQQLLAPIVSLNKHVLPGLQNVTRLPRTGIAASEPFTFTIALNWSDPT